MEPSPTAIQADLDSRFIAAGRAKVPAQILPVEVGVLQISEEVRLVLMPENRFAEDEAEGHVIGQDFERAGGPPGPQKINMRPSPETAVPIAAIVALHAKAQGFARELAVIERDLTGNDSIRMRSARKSDPSFVTQGYREAGRIAQIPCNLMLIHMQAPSAAVFVDGVIPNLEMKWTAVSCAELEGIQGESLNEGAGLFVRWEPGGPHLDRRSQRIPNATISPRIQQQIAEPPGAAAIGETEADEPGFIAPARREGREDSIEIRQCSSPRVWVKANQSAALRLSTI